MSRRRIGQEKFSFAVDRGRHCELARQIDWASIERHLAVISCAASPWARITWALVSTDACARLGADVDRYGLSS